MLFPRKCGYRPTWTEVSRVAKPKRGKSWAMRFLPRSMRDPALRGFRAKLAELDQRFNIDSTDLVDLARQLGPPEHHRPRWKLVLLSGWKRMDAWAIAIAVVWTVLWFILSLIVDFFASAFGHHLVIHVELELLLDFVVSLAGMLAIFRLSRRCIRYTNAWLNTPGWNANLGQTALGLAGNFAAIYVIVFVTVTMAGWH